MGFQALGCCTLQAGLPEALCLHLEEGMSHWPCSCNGIDGEAVSRRPLWTSAVLPAPFLLIQPFWHPRLHLLPTDPMASYMDAPLHMHPCEFWHCGGTCFLLPWGEVERLFSRWVVVGVSVVRALLCTEALWPSPPGRPSLPFVTPTKVSGTSSPELHFCVHSQSHPSGNLMCTLLQLLQVLTMLWP